MMRLNRKGFTLVEIMIVVAIIALLAAIAIPNLLRARLSAQEASAVAAVQTVSTAQHSWRGSNATYTDLASLGAAIPPYIDSILGCATGVAGGSCLKQGFHFSTPLAASGTQFVVEAAPDTGASVHAYYCDEDGVVCRSDAVVVGAAGPGAVTGLHAGALACPAGYSPIQ